MGQKKTECLWSRHHVQAFSKDLADSGLLEQEVAFVSKEKASHKVTHKLCNICNLSVLGGHYLSKRLDVIFTYSLVLYDSGD